MRTLVLYFLILIFSSITAIPAFAESQTLAPNLKAQQVAMESKLNRIVADLKIVQGNMGYINNLINTKQYDKAMIAIDKDMKLVERINADLQSLNLNFTAPIIDDLNSTLGSMHFVRGLIFVSYYRDYMAAEASFVKATTYRPELYMKLIENVDIATKNGNYVLTELYLTSLIKTPNMKPSQLADFYRLRAELRKNILNNQLGAQQDYAMMQRMLSNKK